MRPLAPTPRRRRLPLLALLLLSALLLAAACSTPAPKASNAVPPPATVDPDPLVWAALGGSESVVFDPATAPEAWMQVVFSQLPESSQLVDVAIPDATVSAAIESQLVALQASPSVPTVATLWFGAADRSTSSTAYRASLKRADRHAPATRREPVVVVTRTDDGVGGAPPTTRRSPPRRARSSSPSPLPTVIPRRPRSRPRSPPRSPRRCAELPPPRCGCVTPVSLTTGTGSSPRSGDTTARGHGPGRRSWRIDRPRARAGESRSPRPSVTPRSATDRPQPARGAGCRRPPRVGATLDDRARHPQRLTRSVA